MVAEGRYTKVEAAGRRDWTSLTYFDGAPIPFKRGLRWQFPDLGFAVVKGARVYGRQGYVQTRAGEFIVDAQLLHLEPRFKYYAETMAVRPVERVDGRVLNLATTFAWKGNYGHGLLDGLGRIGLLIEAGFPLDTIDRVLAPQFYPKSFGRLLSGLGIDPRIVTPVDERTNVECAELVQTTLPGVFRHYSRHPAVMMRAAGIEPRGSGRRLLMLRTGEERAVDNLEELQPVVDEYGLEVYEPRSSDFPPADFAGADVVIGAHGSNLADLGVCAPGAALIELMPTGQTMPYFATLAVSSGMSFTGVRGQSVTNDWRANFTIDPAHLRGALQVSGVEPAR
ncbi:DUF563 domain-containing protein [Demequina sp. NBRC 110056]|uniref:glycosyltransferase family 61 protein n=1 Tax=Demequina sp. NBRC 110056 TaxID=1570345 RepID=UPI0013563B38|nr:glycosyltransferase family 61 protein [Demequina sp. NBRC 110056]